MFIHHEGRHVNVKYNARLHKYLLNKVGPSYI